MPKTSPPKTNLDALLSEGSEKKIRKFKALWPRISQAMNHGIAHKKIIEALKADGLELTLNTFDSYSRRVRNEYENFAKYTKDQHKKTDDPPSVPTVKKKDPKTEDIPNLIDDLQFGSSDPRDLDKIFSSPSRRNYYRSLVKK